MIRLAVFFLALGLAFGERYDIAVIPPPDGFTSFFQAYGINNSGQVAGTGVIGNTVQAFVGSPKGSLPVPLPVGYDYSRVFGINSFGQVAGYVATTTPPIKTQAFIGTPGDATLIPLPTGWTTSNAYGVNDSGVTVGAGGTDPDGPTFRVFIGSAAVPLAPEWTSGFLPESCGYTINNSGQIVGYVTSGSNTSPFIGTAEGVNLIHPPRGWIFASVGYGLNDAGEVAVLGSSGTNSQVFVYTATGTQPVPLPSGATTVAINGYSNMNNAGTVVGWSDAGAWIWQDSQGTVLLNTLVPSGWNVTDALGISDNGLILARASFEGGASQFVELLPDPHPARR